MAKGKGKIKGWITKNGVHIPIYDHYTVREGHEPGESGLKSKFKKPVKKQQEKHTYEDIKKGLIFGTAHKAPDYIDIDGYSNAKTEEGALRDLAKAVEQYDEGEADAIRGMIKNNEVVQFPATKDSDYILEWEDVPAATKYNDNGDPEYKDARYYMHTRIIRDDAKQLRNSIEKDIKSKMENYWKNSEYKDSFVKSDVKDTMERVDRMLGYMKGKDIIEPGDNKDIPNEIKWKFAGRNKATGKRASFEFSDSANVQKAKETLRGNGYTVSTGKIFPVNIYNALADTTNMDSYDVRAAEALTKAALSEWKKRNKK